MAQPSTSPTPDGLHRIRVRREGHEWVFAFTLCDAEDVAQRAVQLARDPHAPFDDYDALLVARHLQALLAEQAGAV
jgi:hypothetical protein